MARYISARRLQRIFQERHVIDSTPEFPEPEFQPRHTAADAKCFACCRSTSLKTGVIAGVAILWCAQHEQEYRDLKAAFTPGSDKRG